MTAPLTNDQLIMLRSRMYRGYRAPVATTEFFEKERIESMNYDGAGNVTQLVQSITFADGEKATKTTVFNVDGSGNITGSTVTYNYDDTRA